MTCKLHCTLWDCRSPAHVLSWIGVVFVKGGCLIAKLVWPVHMPSMRQKKGSFYTNRSVSYHPTCWLYFLFTMLACYHPAWSLVLPQHRLIGYMIDNNIHSLIFSNKYQGKSPLSASHDLASNCKLWAMAGEGDSYHLASYLAITMLMGTSGVWHQRHCSNFKSAQVWVVL